MNSNSFENIKIKWVPEIIHFNPNVPYILCGTKIDLRNSKEDLQRLTERGLQMITFEMGTNLAKEIGATTYVETSAINNLTRHVFDEAIRVVITPKPDPKEDGCILQ